MIEHAFLRTEMLLGKEALDKLKNSKVAVFGIGGVGSFVCEALVRSGVGHLVFIDNDTVAISNINRQIHATTKTVDRYKAEVMKERALEINPNVDIVIHNQIFNAETVDELLKEDYDYVVDAIDMVTSKILLVDKCKEMNIPIMASMGTGNKLNPAQLEVSDIHKTSVCPLAKVMRQELKKRGIRKLKVVYSKELPLKPIPMKDETVNTTFTRRQTPGSVGFVPSVAGLIIASEVIKDLIGYNQKK
ncbi:MAG: tRNA threonylcarbamoyladenosine dehydratase [Cellulosilyticaceae bacterium]